MSYIFSDKTGTLTRNIMEFKLCHIGNEIYGDASILENEHQNNNEGEKVVLRFNKKQGVQYCFKNKQIENVLYNPSQNESSRCDFKVMSKSRKVTFRLQH